MISLQGYYNTYKVVYLYRLMDSIRGTWVTFFPQMEYKCIIR